MALKDLIKSVGSFIPGGILAKGLGFTFAMKDVNRLQVESDRRQRELDEQVKRRLKDPTITADEKKRLIKAARETGRYNVIEEFVKEAPTSKQVIASAAELAAIAALGFKPKLPAGASFKYAGDVVKAQKLIKATETAAKVKQMTTAGKIGFKAGKLAITTAREAAIGAGWFGLSRVAVDKDATTNDIVKAAETGALVGGGVVVGMTGLGLAARGVGKVIGPPIKRGLGKITTGIERAAVGIEKPLAEGASQVDKTLSYIGEAKAPLKQKIAQATMAGLQWMRKMESRLIDRFSPLKRIEKRLIELNPEKPLAEYQKVYRDARLLQAVSDAGAEQKATSLIDKLNPYKDVRKESTAYISQLDFIDRARLGQATPGGQTKAQLTEGLSKMMQEMGPDKAKRVGQVRQIMKDYNVGFLKERIDGGVISQELMDKLLATHPNYIPHNVMMDIEERTIQGLGQSLNVSKTDIMKAIGSVRNIQDPIEATIQRTAITTRLIEKNKLLNNLVVAQETSNIMPGARALETAERFGKRIEILTDLKALGKENKPIRKFIGYGDQEARGIQTKLNQTQREMNTLFEEASVRASEFEPKSKITDLIEKASTRERKIYGLTVNKELNITKNKELNDLLSERIGFIKDLRSELQLVKKGTKQFGEETINFFRDGIKETWVVPGDIAVAVKNLDAVVTPTWFKIATTPQRLLKKFATQYNLSFTLPNKFRDKQTAYLTAQGFIDDLAKRYGTTGEGVIPKNWKELYKPSGGYGASIFREGESKILKDLEKVGMSKNLSGLRPDKIIDNINNFIETSTRLEVFKMGLKRGLSPKDAAFASREATIDFAKMGTWMKPLNQAVPFLNARVQGFINLPRAFVKNPEVFARMQLYTAVYPTVALHQHNRRFDSYANISPYMKNKYWIIMTGETDGVDNYTGNPIKVPQFVSIMKGEGQSLVSGPIQYFLDKNDGVDFRKTSEMIADVIGSASPLEFQTWGGGNIWLSLAAQMGPAVSIPAGLAAGKVPYTGMPMVPEARKKAEPYMQFAKYTPEITKEVGKILNVSPAEIDFIISSFGGLPQDMQRAVDMVYNVVRDGKLGGNSISETPWGSLTQIPMARRFIRESAERGYEREFRYKQKEEIEKGLETEKLKVYDKAEKIWQEMNKKETKDERLNYLNSLGDELTDEIRERIKTLKTSRNTVEALKKSDSVELRARYILQRMFEMPTKEERIKFLDNLEAEKILTDKVRKRLAELKAGQ